MARIKRKSKKLTNSYIDCLKKALCGLAAGVFGLILAVALLKHSAVISVIFLLAALGGGIYFNSFYKKARIYKAGLDGEKATAKILAKLPDNYKCFQNLVVNFNGRKNELDMVAVGPTGVFIIETKNLGGTVIGNADDERWTQKKTGKNGMPYSKTVFNPIKQVETHVYRLANSLRSRGVNVFVQPIIYFANPDTTLVLSGNDSEVAVFNCKDNGEKALCEYIMSRPAILNQKDMEKTVRMIEKMK